VTTSNNKICPSPCLKIFRKEICHDFIHAYIKWIGVYEAAIVWRINTNSEATAKTTANVVHWKPEFVTVKLYLLEIGDLEVVME